MARVDPIEVTIQFAGDDEPTSGAMATLVKIRSEHVDAVRRIADALGIAAQSASDVADAACAIVGAIDGHLRPLPHGGGGTRVNLITRCANIIRHRAPLHGGTP
jgi:hypothetical protein